jgi:hypothetical protein
MTLLILRSPCAYRFPRTRVQVTGINRDEAGAIMSVNVLQHRQRRASARHGSRTFAIALGDLTERERMAVTNWAAELTFNMDNGDGR